MSAWLAVGGRTPEFLATVDRIIGEDGGIEILFTGLIDLTVLFAHMTAGALGTTAEALLGGALDLYSEVATDGHPIGTTGTGSTRSTAGGASG